MKVNAKLININDVTKIATIKMSVKLTSYNMLISNNMEIETKHLDKLMLSRLKKVGDEKQIPALNLIGGSLLTKSKTDKNIKIGLTFEASDCCNVIKNILIYDINKSEVKNEK